MGHAVITWDRADPLAQAAGESRRANQALRDYATMGAGRSLRKLHERYLQQASNKPPTGLRLPTTSFTTLSTWSLKHDWVARTERWDGLAAQEAEAAWRERREEEREEEWQLTRALFRRARDMLDYPLVVEVEDEDSKTVQRPTNWRMADAARFIELAAKLARLAARMHDDDPSERALPETIFYIPDNGRPIQTMDDEAGDGPDY
jgi:hypothetical protein